MSGKTLTATATVPGVIVTTADGDERQSVLINGQIFYGLPTRDASPEVAAALIDNETSFIGEVVELSNSGFDITGDVACFPGNEDLPAGGIELTHNDVAVVITGAGTDDATVRWHNPFQERWDRDSLAVGSKMDLPSAVEEGMWTSAMSTAAMTNPDLLLDSAEFSVSEMVTIADDGALITRMFVERTPAGAAGAQMLRLDYNHGSDELHVLDSDDPEALGLMQSALSAKGDLSQFFRDNLRDTCALTGRDAPTKANQEKRAAAGKSRSSRSKSKVDPEMSRTAHKPRVFSAEKEKAADKAADAKPTPRPAPQKAGGPRKKSFAREFVFTILDSFIGRKLSRLIDGK